MAGYNKQTLPRASVTALCWQLPYWFPVLREWPCFERQLMKALVKAELRLVQAFKPGKKRSQLQDTRLPLKLHSIYYHFPLLIRFKGIFATLCPVLIQEYLTFNQHRWFLGQLTENSCSTASPAVAVSWLGQNNTNSSATRTQQVLQKTLCGSRCRNSIADVGEERAQKNTSNFTLRCLPSFWTTTRKKKKGVICLGDLFIMYFVNIKPQVPLGKKESKIKGVWRLLCSFCEHKIVSSALNKME